MDFRDEIDEFVEDLFDACDDERLVEKIVSYVYKDSTNTDVPLCSMFSLIIRTLVVAPVQRIPQISSNKHRRRDFFLRQYGPSRMFLYVSEEIHIIAFYNGEQTYLIVHDLFLGEINLQVYSEIEFFQLMRNHMDDGDLICYHIREIDARLITDYFLSPDYD